MDKKRIAALVFLVGLALAGNVGMSLGRERPGRQGDILVPDAAAAVSMQAASLTWQLETVDGSDDVGTHTSLALDSNDQPHISYYDETSSDLKYAAHDGATWQIVTVDSSGSVGQFTSLALDSNDRPHISFYDETNKTLKYAAYDGAAWQIETVDDDGDVGRYTSLELDSKNQAHISYLDVSNTDLKYAAYDGAAWQIKTVDSAGSAGYFTSLALDSAGRPHISYIRYASPQTVRYAQFNGSAWLLETVYESSSRPLDYTSLSLDAGGVPHIAWHLGTPMDHFVHTLMYATYDGSWQSQAVDSDGVVGEFPSLALDPAGRPHISYLGANKLKCAYYFDATWTIETVDNSATVGKYASLALDSAGQPHIGYHDETNGDLKHASDVPLRFQRRAAQLIEEVRGTDMAPGWDTAQLGSEVRPLFRPDVAGIAYYDFPIVLAGIGAGPQSVGFVIVSTGDHDFPIPEWDFTGKSPTEVLTQKGEEAGLSAARFFKLDVLTYAAETEQGDLAALVGELPPRLSGVDATWLDDPPPSFEVLWTPNVQAEDDANAAEMSGTLHVSGTLTPPASLEWSAWGWDELKTEYGDSYEVPLAWLQREARQAWEAEDQLETGSDGLRRGETRTLNMLWSDPTVSLSGEGSSYVQSQLVPRSGLPPRLEITVLQSIAGRELPLTVTIEYPNGATETFSFAIVQPCTVWLPLVTRGLGDAPALTAQRAEGHLLPQGGCFNWTSWSHWWAGGDLDQRWYEQISCNDPVNTDTSWSGCGATAWAMLFGWADNQASIGNPYWEGRWGLYRHDGGDGADAVAPSAMDEGVKHMTWEIRNHIDTWKVYIKSGGCWQGATDPGDMPDASAYVDGRSYTRLSACGSTLWPTAKCRNKAANAIKRGGGEESPAVIGISLTGGSHYALAYGYKERKLKGCLGETWWTSREFYVNQGWGENAENSRGWVNGYYVWFAGEIRPHAPPQTNLVDDVALYRTSDHKWYYDFGHNGDTNAVGGAWGTEAGDLPLAGDFDRDGFNDDVAIFRSLDGTWHYDYDRSGSTNEHGGPWGQAGNLPLAGDFDSDGYADDVAVFDPSSRAWCYDLDHNNVGCACDDWSGPWGHAGDRPFAGDFDRDGYLDDVAVFRPSTHVAHYDYSHNGTTDKESTHFTTETGIPVAGDFDNDGYVDDVVFFLADWAPTSIWFYDHDHNGPADDVSEWGWADGLPVAGAFGGDQDP